MDIPYIEKTEEGFPLKVPCWEEGNHGLLASDDEEIKATLWCSNGHCGAITTHTIADDGTVNPSCVCDRDGCKFHETVRLIGWTPKK